MPQVFGQDPLRGKVYTFPHSPGATVFCICSVDNMRALAFISTIPLMGRLCAVDRRDICG